ncbi:MAG TPA: F0F1 ATP synthase subunit epsilon [Sulfuricella sp.]|nr:F0F1 ATP synthase subunit epsilon [Sulfuricella sp.]
MNAHTETATIRVNIVSLENEIYSGVALRVTAPALLGEVGILPRHAPMLTPLRTGEVRILTPQNTEELVFITGGMLEVQPTLVTILADTAVRAKHTDRAAADEARKLAAESALHQDRFTAEDIAHAELLASIAEMMAEKERIKRRRRW